MAQHLNFSSISLNIYITLIIVNFLIFIFFRKFSNFLGVYDYPNKRKIHTKKISSIGGVIFLINLITIFFLYFYNFNFSFEFIESFNYLFRNKKEFLAFLLGIIFFFILGYLDDKYNLSPNNKIFWILIILSIILLLDENLRIDRIFILEKFEINFSSSSFFFTMLCIISFINFINMFDGINLQVISYVFFIICFLIFKNIFFLIYFLIPLLFLLILNYKNIIFLGNNGSILISFWLSFILIKTHKVNLITFEDVVLLLFVPFFDMIRLMIFRTLNDKHLFTASMDHIHHILLRKIGFTKTTLIIQSMIIFPVIANQIYNYSYLYVFLVIIGYIYLIKKYNNNV